MKKIMLVDPRGRDENYYLNGMVDEMSKIVDLTVVSQRGWTIQGNFIKKELFTRAIKPNNNIFIKIKRGFNYINSYAYIYRNASNYDFIHFQWLLLYSVDIFYLRKIKNKTKIVYTAHNVIPHQNGDNYIKNLKTIYGLVDYIIVHGETVKEEFFKYFPEYIEKVYIQKHGMYFGQNTAYDISKISDYYTTKINNSNMIFLFIGHMFYNKGTDLLAKVWLENFNNTSNLLIIAGKKNGSYPELEILEKDITATENMIYYDDYVDENLFNYFMTICDMVVLPYRHASMSGVIFTASQFKKPVLATNTGSINEYIINNVNSLVIDSGYEGLRNGVTEVSTIFDKRKLQNMGELLQNHINSVFSWKQIVFELNKDIYEKN